MLVIVITTPKIGQNSHVKNEDRAVGPLVFVSQQHPQLKLLGRKSIQNFLRDRESYLRRPKKAVEEGSTFEAVTLVASADFDSLTSLVDLDTFLGITTLDELADDILRPWLAEQDEVTLEAFHLEDLNFML